jgi:hypothetical protein
VNVKEHIPNERIAKKSQQEKIIRECKRILSNTKPVVGNLNKKRLSVYARYIIIYSRIYNMINSKYHKPNARVDDLNKYKIFGIV